MRTGYDAARGAQLSKPIVTPSSPNVRGSFPVAVAVAVVVAVVVGKTSVQNHCKNCVSVKMCAKNIVFSCV